MTIQEIFSENVMPEFEVSCWVLPHDTPMDILIAIAQGMFILFDLQFHSSLLTDTNRERETDPEIEIKTHTHVHIYYNVIIVIICLNLGDHVSTLDHDPLL